MTVQEFTARIRELAEGRLARAIVGEASRLAMETEGQAKLLARTRLRVRSGNLGRSIVGSVTDGWPVVGLSLKAGGGTKEVGYARLQEYGGTVRPKGHPFLAIPVGPALTPSGVPRFPLGPRSVPGLTFVPIRGGAMGLLVRGNSVNRYGARGTKKAFGQVFYVLQRSSTVTGKRFMRDPWEQLEREAPARFLAAGLAAVNA